MFGLLRGRENTAKKEAPLAPAAGTAAEQPSTSSGEGTDLSAHGEDAPNVQKTACAISRESHTEGPIGAVAVSAVTNEAGSAEIKTASATTETKSPISSAVEGAQHPASKAEKKPKRVASKNRRNRKKESNSPKKAAGSSDAKSNVDSSAAETKKAGETPAARPTEHQAATSVDVHSSCKKALASLQASVHHWKSAMEKISEETHAISGLSAELRLSAIKSICDEAVEKELNDQDVNAKKYYKRQRLRKVPNFKHRSPHQPDQQQPQQRRSHQQQGESRRPQPSQTFSNRLAGMSYGDGQERDSRWTHAAVGNRDMRGDSRPNYQSKQGRFYAGPGFNSRQHPPARDPLNSNRQFHYPANGRLATAQLDLPSLSSAAQSDHPVCIGIREALRKVEDPETLTQLIMKAEALKIQDLADRGRRKLEKLEKQQQNRTTAV